MKITALVENTTANKNLSKQHGLSLYIETTKHKLLVDMGNKDAFIKNANKLGIDLSAVDTAIITHGHFDHAGGLKYFLQINKTAKVYIQRTAFDSHFLEKFVFKINVGIDKKLKTHPQIVLVDGDLQIDKELLLIANPKGKELLPDQSKLVRKGENGRIEQDGFTHEQSLLLTDGKTLLISGCSHRGIVNILNKAKENKPIDFCIGALHFYKLPPNDNLIKETAERLNKEESTSFYTCHCTGVKQYEQLKMAMGEKMKYLSTGDRVTI